MLTEASRSESWIAALRTDASGEPVSHGPPLAVARRRGRASVAASARWRRDARRGAYPRCDRRRGEIAVGLHLDGALRMRHPRETVGEGHGSDTRLGLGSASSRSLSSSYRSR